MQQKNSSLAQSFSHAWDGFVQAVKRERNMKVHLFMTAAVVVCSLVFGLSTVEKAIVWSLCGAVISAELFNTAMENVVDLCSPDFSPLAKFAKDMAAAGVFAVSIAAAAAGTAIFLPYGLELIQLVQQLI